MSVKSCYTQCSAHTCTCSPTILTCLSYFLFHPPVVSSEKYLFTDTATAFMDGPKHCPSGSSPVFFSGPAQIDEIAKTFPSENFWIGLTTLQATTCKILNLTAVNNALLPKSVVDDIGQTLNLTAKCDLFSLTDYCIYAKGFNRGVRYCGKEDKSKTVCESKIFTRNLPSEKAVYRTNPG